jgi:putative acetyltransferase
VPAAVRTEVRPETSEDFDAITALLTEAFGQPAEARLVQGLRAEGVHVPDLTLVAEVDGTVVGHILFSGVVVEDLELGTSTPGLALAPMAVLPAHQRRGIGSTLVRAALERADHRPEAVVVVVGHPRYYPRFGFVAASSLSISVPWPDIPADAVMVRPLPAYSESCRGLVRYPRAFDAL